MKTAIVIFSVVVLATITSSYPTGAPPSSCGSSIPRHGNHVAQTTPPPVKIILSETKVQPGQAIEIKIVGIEPDYGYKGFLIQAKNVEDNALVGTMIPIGNGSRIVDCDGPKAVTQTNIDLKNTVTVNWKAPEVAGNVKIQ